MANSELVNLAPNPEARCHEYKARRNECYIIPDALQEGIAKLSAPLKQLLMGKSVPYLIQHRLGSENYVTVEDLADRWDSAQVARQQRARELGFEADHNGFTAASSGFAAMKLFQVVRAAKEMIQTHRCCPMVGRKKKRRKNGQRQPLGVSWSVCTWYSETPC